MTGISEFNEINAAEADVADGEADAVNADAGEKSGCAHDACKCGRRNRKGCPVKGRCPVRKLFAAAEDGDAKANAVAGAVTLAVMCGLIVATYYSQFVLTKWAVKSALKETRLR